MRVAFQTDVGMRRDHNEDAINIFSNKDKVTMYILCDGVGGHQSGEVASRMVVNYLGTTWRQTQTMTEDQVVEWLIGQIEEVNRRVYQRAGQFSDLKGMSTTVVCAIVLGNRLLIAYVGDSRLYMYRHNELRQITQDHSLVNDLLALGGLTPEEAVNHPMKNVITRAIGHKEQVEVDIIRVTLVDKDYILLCSDGLTDMLSDQLIEQSFKEWHPLQTRVDKWVHQANLAGGKDNISVILIQYTEEGES